MTMFKGKNGYLRKNPYHRTGDGKCPGILNQLDEHGFYRPPTSFDIHEYDIMEEFIDYFPEPAQSRLGRVSRGKVNVKSSAPCYENAAYLRRLL